MAQAKRTDSASTQRLGTRVTKQGVVFTLFVIALLIISLIQRLNLMTLFFSVSVTPLFAALWMGTRNLKGLEVRATLPRDLLHAGATVLVELEVHNRRQSSGALGLVVTMDFQSVAGTSAVLGGRSFLPLIGAQQTIRESCPIGAAGRGIYRRGQVVLSSQFPFGFFSCRHAFDLPGELVVYPQIGRIDGRVPLLRSPGGDVSQRTGGQRGAQFDQYRHLREYRIGDNPRHVHWRSTARRGELMVKEFEPDGASPTLLLLDTLGVDVDAVLFERMVSFVATVCVEMSRQPGLRGMLAIAADKPILVEGHGPGRWLHQALRALAAVQPTATDGLNECARVLNKNKKHLGPQIWILGFRSREQYAESLATNLGKDGFPAKARFQCIGATDLEKFFRMPPALSYVETQPVGQAMPNAFP